MGCLCPCGGGLLERSENNSKLLSLRIRAVLKLSQSKRTKGWKLCFVVVEMDLSIITSVAP